MRAQYGGWFECHAHGDEDDDDAYGWHFGYKVFLIKRNIFNDTNINSCITNKLFSMQKIETIVSFQSGVLFAFEML